MTVIATAGHVDHGKSSLVLALTGTDPDRFEEEKRRGLTIDLGFAHTTLPSGTDVSFVDVPGHVRFLRNMLAGVGGVTACVFVIAATEGWKPQSEEHLRILELLGIGTGIVVLSKADLVDDETLEIAELEISERVEGTFLDGAPVVPFSAHSGQGLDDVKAALESLVREGPPAADRGRTRLWIDRVFAARGSGTVVTGTLVDGPISVDDAVVVEPGARRARVRAIQTAGRSVDSIAPGNRVALNLASVDHGDLHRGHVVVEPDRWLNTDRVDASLNVLGTLSHEVSRRGAYVAYFGSGEHAVKVRVLGTETLGPGAVGAIRVFLPEPLPLLPGDRFILRESGRDETVGGGEVLDVAPVLRASRAAPDRSVDRVVAERGWVTVHDLERLTGEQREPTVGDWVATADALEGLRNSIASRVEGAGPTGLDIAVFDERERAVLATMDDIETESGRVRPADAVDPYAEHPVLAALKLGGFAPPAPDGAAREDLRELARRGLIVQRDGVVFHAETVDAAAREAARLLAVNPDGFTVAQFRDATGASRKYALPLVSELDARGITRRRDDLRIAGPRLPTT